MGKMKRRYVGGRKGLLVALVAGTVVMIWSSAALAAANRTAVKPSVGDTTILDPFTLKTVVPSTRGLSPAPALRDAPGIIRNPNPRRSIRIPSRLPVRSGCRPWVDP